MQTQPIQTQPIQTLPSQSPLPSAQTARQKLLCQAAKAIQNANSLVLSCHVRPDADALGSLLGLALGLEQIGKRVVPLSPDGVPAGYRFLPGWEKVQAHASGYHALGTFDIGIGLDADGSDRLGEAEAVILAQPLVIDIDHHTGPDPYGQIQVVDRTAAATGELVFQLLEQLGVRLTVEIATNLLAAVLTDTGSFRFNSVTPETFRIAAALTEAGAHPGPIFEAVYGRRAFAASRLLGRLLERLEASPDGRIVWAAIARSDFQELGVDSEATEGFVDQIRMVEGSDVALFFREEPNGEIRVSLRSRGGVNVAQAAAEFGGGGHRAASGCTLLGPLHLAVPRVVAAVRREMGQG